MNEIFIVVLRDEPIELESAWTTRELAQAEIDRQLEAQSANNVRMYYWLQSRLGIETIPVRA
jgi:hypothetical protein